MPTHTRASPQSGPKAVNNTEKEESNKDLVITITPMKLQVTDVGVAGKVAPTETETRTPKKGDNLKPGTLT